MVPDCYLHCSIEPLYMIDSCSMILPVHRSGCLYQMKSTSQVIRNGFVSFCVAKEHWLTGSLDLTMALTFSSLGSFFIQLLQLQKTCRVFMWFPPWNQPRQSPWSGAPHPKIPRDSWLILFQCVQTMVFQPKKTHLPGSRSRHSVRRRACLALNGPLVINQLSLGVTKFEPKHQSLRADCRVSTRTNRWQGVVSLRLQTPKMHPNVTRYLENPRRWEVDIQSLQGRHSDWIWWVSCPESTRPSLKLSESQGHSSVLNHKT